MDRPPQERILDAVLRLLDEGGVDAVSTRAVGAAADVQAPAIYRLFGDKQGLLLAAVERGYADWVARKGERPPIEDPVEALRAGWDDAVAFGTDHPAMYRISASSSSRSPALAAGLEVLRAKVRRVAAAGRLRVSEEQAVALMSAAGRGVTLTVIDGAPGSPAADDLRTQAREAVIAAITTERGTVPDPAPRTLAAALRAVLPETDVLRPAERALMDEWLERLSAAPGAPPAPPAA